MNKPRLVLLLTVSAFIFSLGLSTLNPRQASAISGQDFNAGNIIDDAVFYNSNSMSTSEIQRFLDSKVSNGSCDSDGSRDSGTYYYRESDGRVSRSSFSGGVETHSTRKLYGQRYNAYHNTDIAATPFRCLTIYTQKTPAMPAQSGICGDIPAYSSRTTAQIIHDAATACGISPKVLLVLLQKEQSLVTDDWPWKDQLRKATGFSCPDDAPCDPSFEGLFYQVYYAAHQYKLYRANPTNYNYVAGQNNYIYYNPDPSCGGSWVYIENQATAGLYDYTPYQPNDATLAVGLGVEAPPCGAYGNKNFWWLFTAWFGSTQFPQPAGAMLYRQSSNGRIYLVITSSNTRYYIASPSMMDNYGLSKYRTIPASDNDISQLTDGGDLTNLVRDQNGNIYLVNNGKRHHIPGSATCTAWGLACFDSRVVQSLGNQFVNNQLKAGATLSNTMQYQGVYYELANGRRLPFANEQSVVDSGFITRQALDVNSVNATQPLGKLIVTTPGIIKFSPKSTLYYYDGTSYWSIGSMSAYNGWRLGEVKAINEPKSTYNTTEDPVVTGDLSFWHVDKDGAKYVINSGTKLKLSATQTNLWPDASFGPSPTALLNNLPTRQLQTFIKNGINFYKLVPDAGEKRYIAGMSNYRDLGVTRDNTTHLASVLTDSIKSGPFAFANGRLIKVEGDTAIYVMNDGKLMHVASMVVLNAYRFNTSEMRTYPLAGVNEYQRAGQLRNGLLPDGSAVIPYERSLIKLSAKQVTDYGLQTSGFEPIASDMVKRARLQSGTKFWRNSDNGRIFYAEGGSLHHVSSLQKYYELGGRSTPLTSANTSIIDMFTIGNPV